MARRTTRASRQTLLLCRTPDVDRDTPDTGCATRPSRGPDLLAHPPRLAAMIVIILGHILVRVELAGCDPSICPDALTTPFPPKPIAIRWPASAGAAVQRLYDGRSIDDAAFRAVSSQCRDLPTMAALKRGVALSRHATRQERLGKMTRCRIGFGFSQSGWRGWQPPALWLAYLPTFNASGAAFPCAKSRLWSSRLWHHVA